MLLHDNYYLFFVNRKPLVEFHCIAKHRNCIFRIKCILVMAESDKTLVEGGNRSNNNRNNSVPSVSSLPSGTSIPDTHPTHHAVVSEPSTLKRKQTSFQITSVTVKGSRLSTDGGEDSADDLDESHTEDANSDILDCSRTTDIDNDQLSEDTASNANNNGDATKTSPSIPIVNELKQGEANASKLPIDGSKATVPGKQCENVQGDFVKPPDLPDQWQHRFRVVKIVSSEPFKRGRWLCMDFMDPPAPIMEAKAEIVETAVSSNVLISGSLSESIPADKIAHIYEISPSDAYPGSISVAGSDQIQQPMYGIFLPVNNGQYPLITGMHSRAIIRPSGGDLKVHSPAHSIDQKIQQTHSNIPQHMPSMSSVPQQSQTPNMIPQTQNTSNIPQQSLNVGSQPSLVAVSNLPPHTVSVAMHQSQNIGLQQSQHVSTGTQAPSTIGVPAQQSQSTSGSLHQSQNSQTVMQLPSNILLHHSQNSQVGMQQMSQVPPVTTFQQSQNIATSMHQAHMVATVTHPMSGLQSQNVSSGLQQPQNVSIAMQQVQNISAAMQQPQNVVTMQQTQNILAMQPSQNIPPMQQMQNVSAMQQVQSIPATMQQVQSIPATMQQVQSIPATMQHAQNLSTMQQPQMISGTVQQMQNSGQSSISEGQLPVTTHIVQSVTSHCVQPVASHMVQAVASHGVQSIAPHNVHPVASLGIQHVASQNMHPISSQAVQPVTPVMSQPALSMQNLPQPQAVREPVATPIHPPMPSGDSAAYSSTPPHSMIMESHAHKPQNLQPSQILQNQQACVIETVPRTHVDVCSVSAMSDSSVMVHPQTLTVTPAVPASAPASGHIPEAMSASSIKTECVTVPSQVVHNHVDAKELRTPPSTNVQVSQDIAPENSSSKSEINGDEPESAPSGTNTVAIDNKIEQAMDLVKSHLMFAVREEVDVLKEKITELMDRISQLEMENGFLRANASQETLEQLNQSQLLQQQQQNLPSNVSLNSIMQMPQQPVQQQQINIQNQQPSS